jgi:hypothetical protein
MSTEDRTRYLADRAGATIRRTTGRLTGHECVEHEGTIYTARADVERSDEQVEDSRRGGGRDGADRPRRLA